MSKSKQQVMDALVIVIEFVDDLMEHNPNQEDADLSNKLEELKESLQGNLDD